MNQEILINWTPQETRVAVVEHGAVQEVLIERTLEKGLVGNVYLGKITRVLPGMQSAFIDIGLEKAAFLHVADLLPSAPPNNKSNIKFQSDAIEPLPIEKQLHEGQVIVVQVLKDPIGSKGARLTAQVSVAGRQLVFLPKDEHIGVSQKISPDQRESLRLRLQALTSNEGGGFILRTNAEDATDDDLKEDIRYLRLTWKAIENSSKTMPPCSLLYQDLNLAQRVLRDLATPHTQTIRIDSKEQLASLQSFAQTYTPSLSDKLVLHTGERTVFDLHHVDEDINKALSRKVSLKSGGYLIFDQTEAMTTIDVNTGAFVGNRSFDETIFKTNLEAAQTIARQLRLRNLGGIVIVDFIDMTVHEHKDAVLSELKRQLARDRVKTSVGQFSPLGLLELTRKRTRESLATALSDVCPTCEGKGLVKSVRTVCYDILREILTESKTFQPAEFRIVAHPRVIEAFLDEESAYLAGLSDFIGKTIALQSESQMAPDAYDIVLR